ncbi:hypothetical protein RRG08_061008 [Elysia crispata]|uniref:Uncharacterized protein n=1 Tax=Elysia crispata TaxID=231223 RepID=A0AAE1E667_9GAST|nr:hypothetical protein RRG08_061008 [Elysia crispata]
MEYCNLQQPVPHVVNLRPLYAPPVRHDTQCHLGVTDTRSASRREDIWKNRIASMFLPPEKISGRTESLLCSFHQRRYPEEPNRFYVPSTREDIRKNRIASMFLPPEKISECPRLHTQRLDVE